MNNHERRLTCGLFAVTAVWSLALAALGATAGVLFVAPALLLAVPLALGRYLGEGALAAGVARRRTATPRPRRASRPSLRSARRAAPRGGRLIAFHLAKRPPPTLPVPA
jgi:hypothetical protein